jgi:hypothetical protein
MFQEKIYKLVIFGIMMQQMIFQSTFLHTGSRNLRKKVLFSNCIVRFLKAIVFFEKKVTKEFSVIESQHFISRNVGFLFLWRTNSKNQYLRQ